MLFHSGKPCLNCYLPEPPPPEHIATCDTAGVLGAATHFVASLQVSEAIKWLVDRGRVRTKLISVDLWHNRVREFEPNNADSCPACHDRNYRWLEGHAGSDDESTILCGRDSVQISSREIRSIDFSTMNERWQGLGKIQSTRFFIRLLLDDHSLTLFGDGRVVVSGTRDIAEARSLYSRFIGA